MPRHRILIIEDEPAIADNVVYALETEGFQCRWCATGRAGLDALESTAADSSFDFIVLDVGLPDMGGFEVCKEIRKRLNTPVLFLTARSGEIDRVVGLEIGADDYVVKPFSPRELVARIKAILRRTDGKASPSQATAREAAASGAGSVPASRSAGAALEAPGVSASGPARGAEKGPSASPVSSTLPFKLDGERFRIAYFGINLELSRYEFRLLAVLIEKPGRVFSREQLMNKAWDSPESSLDRTVDAHIKSVRAKLRQVKPEIDPIVTHRGLGYSLREEW